jgi:hypothetical protein
MKAGIFLTAALDGHENIIFLGHYLPVMYMEEDNLII